MPITNIFATWSLGEGNDTPEDSKVSAGIEPVHSELKVPSTFVKHRETTNNNTGVHSSLFHPPSSLINETHEKEISVFMEPPNKIQKISHTSFKAKSKSPQSPVPEQISVVICQQPHGSSSSDNHWGSHGQEFGTLSDDDELSQSTTKSDDDFKSRELLPAPFFRYRDHSSEVDEDPLLPLTPFSKIPNFPAKLMAILSRPDFADIVCWMPHGRSWRVLKPREFEIRVLPSYFEHQKLSSFIRQANGWGFHRISQGLDRNSYYHELFLRGLPHLCKKMKRPRVNKKPVVDPDHEPDFYAISDLHPLPSLHKEKTAIHDDILLPSTVIGGPKARMQLHVDKDELRQAVSRALSGPVVLKKPAALASSMPTGLSMASSFRPIGSVQKASEVSIGTMNPPMTSPWVPPTSFALPPSVHSLLSSSCNPATALSLLNPAMQGSGMGLVTNASAPATNATSNVDPLSQLLVLLKHNQQPQQALPTWDSSSGSANPFVNPSQTSAFLTLLNTSVPQASPDAAFAAGFAAATALHHKSTNLSSYNPPVDATKSLELDAATAMFGLMDNNGKRTSS